MRKFLLIVAVALTCIVSIQVKAESKNYTIGKLNIAAYRQVLKGWIQ